MCSASKERNWPRVISKSDDLSYRVRRSSLTPPPVNSAARPAGSSGQQWSVEN
jgi:hypothetical protein